MLNTKYLSVLSIGILLLANHTNAATGATMTATGTSAPTSANSASVALNVPGAPTLTSKTATTATLEWAKVATAKNYIVKYSTMSVAQAFKTGNTSASYDNESDQVSATGTTIKNLKADTTYYFAVVALDATNNESMTNSEELSVTLSSLAPAAAGTGVVTPGANNVALASDFKLLAVSIIDIMTLAVDFSAPLSKDPVTLKIEKSMDKSSLFIKSVVTGKTPNQVIVNLAAPVETSSSYALVVVSAKDASGKPITQGLNAVKEFATSAVISKAAVAASIPGTLSGATLSGVVPSGVSLSGGLNSAPPAALPATGTQETLLLVLAAFLSLGIVYFFRNKKA